MHSKLDFKICLHILNTILNRNYVLAFAECRTVKCRQGKCHLADFHLIAADCHPVHHRKCIIQKMWINLRLQCFQLIFFERNLIYIHFINQTVDLIHHIVETIDQDTNFIFRIAAYRNFTTSMVDLIHIFGKFFNLSCKNS